MKEEAIIEQVQIWIKSDPAFPNASELEAAIRNGELKVIDVDWGSGGAFCRELLDLYRFRRSQLKRGDFQRARDLDYLCCQLSKCGEAKCLLGTVANRVNRFCFFVSNDLQHVLSCIKV